MSTVDVWVVTPTKAMVLTDTEVAEAMVTMDSDTREVSGHSVCRGEASKMLYLPSANVVIAGRGTTLFLGYLHQVMHGCSQHRTFDAYAEAMPGLLQHVRYALKVQLAALSPELQRMQHAQQVALVGWSHASQKMLCLSYESTDESGFGEEHCTDKLCSPWRESWGESMDVKTPEHARIMATEQIARILEEMPDSAHGGRLLLCELTKDDARFSTLARVTGRALLSHQSTGGKP